ncbi:hypothetical protein GF356_04235 [candidate division GN15 bacterium]|nr:hypothetical protein [candidate division GN15 bacterium]
MKTQKYLRFSVLLGLAVLACLTTAVARPPAAEPTVDRSTESGELALSPQPGTADQIVHNRGNVAVTVDNFGYIGGYSAWDLPSGEYPRNSGHNYLAEIMYWMGGVTASGDTLVANTADDFQGIAMPIDGQDIYKIYLSTDTTRYYDYDRTDTVGQGTGNPAFGWRVWDPQTETFAYNQKFNALASDFRPGGPTSLQDSHYRFSDAAMGSALMGLEITHTCKQWDYCYNEDFIFVELTITNGSTEDYTDFAIGIYTDIDVGGPDGSGENGRLQDLVSHDASEGLAWIYDNTGFDPGWKANTGVFGTKLLKTPNDVGLTGFRTDDWAYFPSTDPDRYAMISSTDFDQSLPPTDQFYVMCVGGIELAAGETVEIIYALVAGDDEDDFKANADAAEELYLSNYIGPEPPALPTLRAEAGDEKVHLYWGDTSEVVVDPQSGVVDFKGYKLYRSDNQGLTWGQELKNIDNNCLSVDYRPVVKYEVPSAGDLVQHSYTDTGLYNGVEYWYCLVAFDTGNAAFGVDPLQNGFGIAGEVANVVAVTPRSDPAGHYEAASTVEHQYTGSEDASDGTVVPIVFDREELQGAEYEVTFEEFFDTTYWHVVNTTTGDTVLANQTRDNGDPEYFPVAEGLRVVLRNGQRSPESMGQTSFGGSDTTLVAAEASFYGPTVPTLAYSLGATDSWDTTLIYGDIHYRSTYELRYTGDSTRATAADDPFYGTDFVYWVPFEVWNTTTNQRVSLGVFDFEFDMDWDSYDLLSIINYPYDSTQSVTQFAFPHYYSWLFGFDDSTYNPQVGDVFTIEGAPMNGEDDVFTFRVDGINASQAANELPGVKVVPNPYFGQYSAMVETDNESALEFQNVPDQCTIRIYTLAGDLVETLTNNDGDGVVRWDLLSSNRRQVAAGIYLYHVESPYGEHAGRFAVIK